MERGIREALRSKDPSNLKVAGFEVRPLSGHDEHEETGNLYTKEENGITYAAWSIGKEWYKNDWYVGAMPSAELEDLGEDEQLDTIVKNCDSIAERSEVTGLLKRLGCKALRFY